MVTHFDALCHSESSTTKLLLRLFDACEGEILIDDRPIQDYRADDLRKATSVLWQDYQTFPLTVCDLLVRYLPDH
jgi:ABC-type multidrug transport system fused ATPase/permease subunit